MYLLALETTIGNGSLCLMKGSKIVAGKVFERLVQVSEGLIGGIEKLLGENDILKSEIASIVVSKNQGSLTGYRVGLASALGLKEALSAGLLQVGVFESLFFAEKSQSEKSQTEMLIGLPSGRAKIQWAFGIRDRFETFYTAVDEEQIKKMMLEKTSRNKNVKLFTHPQIMSAGSVNFIETHRLNENIASYTGKFAVEKYFE